MVKPHPRRGPAGWVRADVRVVLAGLVVIVALVGVLATGAVGGGVAGAAARCPWLNESLSVQARVNMLMSRMSLRQQIGEMYIHEPRHPNQHTGYEGWVPAQPALCIPTLVEQDGSLGVYGAPGATQLPSEVSLGSAWDPSLAYAYGVVNAKEHRAKGMAMILGPGVNIDRDPRWGRNFEMFSEDPLLTAELGTADIDGIQSQDVLADVKHFVTYNQETYRDTPEDDTIVGDRALHEIYLPPFYSAVTRAHVASVMCAYPLLNGTYSCQDPALLTDLLDQRWGYAGFVRSDSAANPSTVNSANAGLDQDRGSFYWDNGQLYAAVAEGRVDADTINDAARRILTEMFRFNLFNDPPKGSFSTPASTPSDRALAAKVAEDGTVLLRNTDGILPLRSSNAKSIAVIGSDATTEPETAGGGSSHVTVSSSAIVSPWRGIVTRAGAGVTVRSYSGTSPSRAAAVASRSHVAIVFASYVERENKDLSSISLPGDQDAVIKAVAAANPDTIVVLNTGGPVLMPWLSSVKGVVEAWYPGEEDGTAIAAVLFGDVDPSGHLPETFPRSLAQIPTASRSQFPGVDGKIDYSEGLDVGYRWYDAKGVTPLFPFGYGLSYTKFRYTHLTVTPDSVVNSVSAPESARGQAATVAKVTAVVTNTGAVTGSDVAQLYIGDPSAAGEPPRQLEGFQRVTLRPHQSQTVSFAVTGHELSYFDTAADGWTLPAGQFSLYVGDSSALAQLPLRGSLDVTKTVGSRYAQLTVPTGVAAGSTVTVAARFVNDGSLPITDGTVVLTAPATWSVTPVSPSSSLSLAPGQSATRDFQVTVPESAAGGTGSLGAQLTSSGSDAAGDISASATVPVASPVTVSTRSPAVVVAGGSGTAELSIRNSASQPVVVDLAPAPPAGVTLTPASPTVTVPATSTVKLELGVSVAQGTSPRSVQVPLSPSFTLGTTTYPLAPTALVVDVPYASLAAAYDNRAISDDGDVRAADFDGNGDSYSEQALTAAGLGRGATLHVRGTTLTWPDVAAGTPDNVTAEGQTILMQAPLSATELTVLGSSAIEDESGTSKTEYTGTGTIEYTDGTEQSYKLTFDNWFRPPTNSSNVTVAAARYVNDSTASSNNGVTGERHHRARIFAVSIPLEPGRTVASVTLPTVGTLPGVYPMHIFALALGG